MPDINNNWAIAELLGQVMEKLKKVEKIKFSELGLPGVGIVGAPVGVFCTLLRAPSSHITQNQKKQPFKYLIILNYLIALFFPY